MLQLADGFDYYGTSQWSTRGWSSTQVPTGMVTGRLGGQAVRLANGSFNNNSTRVLPSGISTIIWGFGWNTQAFNHVHGRIQTAGGSTIANFQTNSLKQLQVAVISSTTITGSTILNTGTWYYVEIKLVINGASSTVGLQLNGVTEVAATACNAGTTPAQRIVLVNDDGGGNIDMSVDDLYVADASGSRNNDYLGDVRVEAILPTSDGAHTQWTPNSGSTHYNRVNEVPPDGDTTYVHDSNVGDRDSYGFGNLSEVSGTVFGVQTHLYARKDGTGTRQICASTRPGTTDHDGATDTLSTSYQYFSEIQETNPDTAVPWTISDVNTSEFGVKLVA